MHTRRIRTAAEAAGLRRRLQLTVVAILLLVGGAVIAIAVERLSAIRSEAFAALLDQTKQRAAADVRDFFRPIESSLRLFRKWGMSADMDALSMDRAVAQFLPVLEEFPQISAAMVAGSDGREYFVYREGDGWLARELHVTPQGQRASWRRWGGESDGDVEKWSAPFSYDPRTRPWYRGASAAMGEDAVYWTHPYLFVTAQALGVTAAVGWQQEGRDQTFVIAFDVLLSHVLEHMASIEVSPHGRAFLFSADGRLLADPAATPSAEDLAQTAVQYQALKVWKDHPEAQTGVFPVSAGGERFLAGFEAVPLGGRKLWKGVIVPESDLRAEILARQYWVWAAVAVALMAGVLMTSLVARHFGRHLEAAARVTVPDVQSEAEVKALIAKGEGERLEFKSTMRFNLKAGRSGKEIELAWLKGVVAFLNTDGGALLMGVADDGSVVGLEHDDFANDDKCLLHFNNLVNQHIGQEFARYLSARLWRVDTKQVLLVRCEPAPEPAFLRTRQDEEFYVRTGPRNARLPLSKALDYIQNRRGGGPTP
jgi:hypothetical protein